MNGWRPTKRDVVFLAVVAAVVGVLVLGSAERKARPTPNDAVHRQATTRAACLRCHGEQGVRPRPPGHTRIDQCFMCHLQPEGWAGAQ